MTFDQTLLKLLTTTIEIAPDEEARLLRVQARVDWVAGRVADLVAAQKRADQAWMALVAGIDPADDGEDLPPPPEQAEADAILAELKAVTEKDRWPRKLHWSV